MKRLFLFAAVAALPLSLHAYFPEWLQKGAAVSLDLRSMAAADFDGDGRPDLLVRIGYYELDVIRTGSDGSPGAPASIFRGDYLGDFAVADFDGDHKADVVATDIAANALIFLRSKGDGTFDAPVTTSLTFAPTQVIAADFDGDGRMDVAVRSRSGALLVIYRTDAAGRFTEMSRTSLNSTTYTMAAGDIDGDGRVDLLIAREDLSGFDLFFGKGNGAFEAPVPFTTPGKSARFAIADVDGDGDAEILSAEFDANTVTVRVNLGSRSFAGPVTYFVAQPPVNFGNPADLVVADADGDGRLDVIVPLANQQLIATLPGNGDGSFGAPEYGRFQPAQDTLAAPTNIVAADFDGDGRPDIAVGSYGDGIVIYANAAGTVSMNVFSDTPVISAGQPVTIRVWVMPLRSRTGFDSSAPGPIPAGSVTLKEGSTILGTAMLKIGEVFIDVASLSAGTHVITAEYGGDSSYHAALSPSYSESVIAEKPS